MKSKKAINRLLTLLLVLVMSVTGFAQSGIRVLAAGEDAAVTDEDAVSDDAVSSDDAATQDEVSENEADKQDITTEPEDTDEPSEDVIVPEEEDETASYNLWVGGVAVTDANKNDIKSAVVGSDAKATYNPDTHTLYLYNVESFQKGTGIEDIETSSYAYIYYKDTYPLNIVAQDCSIDFTEQSFYSNKDNWFIYSAADLNISGNIDVTIIDSKAQIGHGIETKGKITFKADSGFECKSIYCTIQSGNTVTVESGAYVNAEIVKYDTDFVGSDQNALCVKKGGLTVDGGTLYLYCRKDGNNANALDVKGTLTLNAGSEFMAVNESKSTPDVSIYGSVKVSGDIIVDKSLYIYDKEHVKKDSDFRYVVNEKDEPSINVQVQEDNTPKLNIWIGGQQVTEGRAYDIWGLNVGSATYDKDTKVLTLNNAGGFKGINHDAWIDCDEEITINGNFSLSMLDGTGVEYLIRSVKDLTVDCNIDMTGMKAYPNRAISTLGDAKLIISGGTYKLRAKNNALYSYKDLVLSGGEIDASSSLSVICSGSADISFDGANVKAINTNNRVTVSAGGNIAFNKGTATIQASAGTAAVSANKKITMDTSKLCIASPEGAKIQGGKIVDADGKDVSAVEIKAVEGYELWLGNTAVTKNNASDIFGDGKASYNPETHVLTLNGVKDFGELYKSGDSTYCIASTGTNELTIKGSAELSGASVGISGLNLIIDADLTINCNTGILSGLGGVKINGGKVVINSAKDGINADVLGGIEVNGGELIVKAGADDSHALKATTIKLYGGKITAEGKAGSMLASSKIILSDKMLILEPKGGKLSTSGKSIVDAEDNTAKKVMMLEKTVQYTVKFDANGHGTAPADVTLWSGECVERPADPAEDGWLFTGWFTDKEATTAYDFAVPVTSDITLYAGWERLNIVSAMNPVPFIDETTEALTLVKGQKFTADMLVGWSIDKADKKYVTISKKGKIDAKKVTTAPVKIWNSDKTKNIEITVVKPGFADKTIKADVSDAHKPCGFSGFGELPVAYYVSNPEVCAIDLKTGELYFFGKGTSTITAYVNGKAYTCKLKVSEKTVLEKHVVYMNANSKKSLKLSGVKFEKFEIASADADYAEIKKNTVIAKDKTGLIQVTGTSKDGKMYLFYVNIEKPAIIDHSALGYTDKGKGKYEINMKVGQEAELYFDIDRYIIVKASKGEIAYASEDGRIHAMKPGSSKLTAKINGKSVTVKVNVTE